MQKTKKWDGAQMLFPIKYQKGVASVAFSGFDLLPITQQPVSVNMTFYPTFVATNVALAGSELSINETPMQTLKLMKVVMESRAQDAADGGRENVRAQIPHMRAHIDARSAGVEEDNAGSL